MNSYRIHIPFFLWGLMMSLWMSSPAQSNREMIMLHGFGDGANGWQVYDDIFANAYAATNLSTHEFPYNNLDGLEEAAEDVLSQLQTLGVPSGSNNIMITHSTGGAVVRMMEHFPNPGQQQLMSDYFGGYINVAAPHQGVKLVNSYQSGDLKVFFDEGCKELSDAGLAILISPAPFQNIFNPIALFGQTAAGDLICNLAFNQLENKLALLLSPNTLDDIRVGSQTLANLPTSSNKFRITLHGAEESPVHWRFFSSLQNPPVHIPSNAYVAGDNEIPRLISRTRGQAWAAAGFFYGLSFVSALTGNLWTTGAGLYVGVQISQAINWLDRSESGWNQLIGANDWYPVGGIGTTQQFQCGSQLQALAVLLSGDPLDEEAFENALTQVYSNPNCWTTQTYTIHVPNHQISDGLAPALSTKIDPTVCHFQINEVNHQEEVHHPQAEAMYRLIFDRDASIVNTCGGPTADFFEIQ